MPLDITKLEPQVVIYGGLTLGLLGMIWLVWKITKQYGNHTMDVIGKNTEAWVENTKSNQKLVDVIEGNYKKKRK